MTQDPQPNLFAIQDLASRQAHKVTWDSLNALRVEKRTLEDGLAALQAQVNALNSGVAAAASLPATLSLLNSQVNIAQDHPNFVLGITTNPLIPNAVTTGIVWDTSVYGTGIYYDCNNPGVGKVYLGRKPGLWLTSLLVTFDTSAVGVREVSIAGRNYLLGQTALPETTAGRATTIMLTTLVPSKSPTSFFPIDGSVKAFVYQDSGAPLNIISGGAIYNCAWFFYFLGQEGP